VYVSKIHRPDCLICEGPGVFDSNIVSDFSGMSFQYLKCKKCGMGWISNPNTDFESLYDRRYYEGQGADPFLTYWDEMFSDDNHFNRKLRNIEYFGIFKTLCNTQNLNSGTPLNHLDFGGGLGGLVYYLNERKINSVLFEEGFSSTIAKKIGLPMEEKPTEEFYDCVTAIEVFEHLIDPHVAAAFIAAALKPGGILLITTGNLSKHRGQISKWYYAKKNPDVHITFFTPLALSMLLGEHGFRKLDSKFNNRIILYKVLKNVFMFPVLINSPFLKKFVLNFSWVLFPVLSFIDDHFGFSEQGLYQKMP
jgi:hypothetical protein